MKNKILAIFFVIIAFLLAFFYLNPENSKKDFAFGLDLSGGTEIIYEADISEIRLEDVDESLEALRGVLQKRLNTYGTSEVSILIEKPSLFSNYDGKLLRRIIVSVPGITDSNEAKKKIGELPFLEFKLQEIRNLNNLTEDQVAENFSEILTYKDVGLSGKDVDGAELYFGEFGQTSVSLNFNSNGAETFRKVTEENIGEVLAIFLDGKIISSPVIQTAILDGNAQITGDFSVDESRELVRNLNFGALPLSIKAVGTNTISPSLGADTLELGIKAGIIGFFLVAIFLIYFYRFSGFLASVSLLIYIIFLLSIFKFFGFVFTAAAIAGFIISIGMAVDANILIFERIKEELKNKQIKDAVEDGFKRAWLSIRDGNLSSILVAIILFYMTTPLIKGFAITFGLGVLVSMLTAISVSRIFLLSFSNLKKESAKKIIFNFKEK